MSEFIGSRISLISKSDIRYIGTLHEINSETSTVALENVTSYGTEGRRSNPAEEISASDSVYEYIVFRGSDVKDLRIEETPKENKPPPPAVPNDPAILGAARPPAQATPKSQPNQPPVQQQQNFAQPPYPAQYGNYPPFQGQRFGPQNGYNGPSPYPGYPPMPYGAPPPWYGHPGQQFPGAFGPPMPPNQPGQQMQQQVIGQKPLQSSPPGLVNPAEGITPAQPPVTASASDVKTQTVTAPTESVPQGPSTTNKSGPPPPIESKPDVAAALATPMPATSASKPGQSVPKTAPAGPKNSRIVPAVPIPSPNVKAAGLPATSKQPATTIPITSQPGTVAANAALQYQNATQAATAAVAAAMAKLPPAHGRKPGSEATPNADGAVDHLTRKVNEMRTDDRNRHPRHPGAGGPHAGTREGRGGRRGGGRDHASKPIDVPSTPYDFESANAKFNKQDLVKEAIATGSPLGEMPPSELPASTANGTDAAGTANGASAPSVKKPNGDVTIPPPAAPTLYNKATSFFDNISSELKDREETSGRRFGGQEFRSEERKKNLETFGQGSVDGGYRGGYRGRGRGRGYRGRGGFSRGRGGGGRGRRESSAPVEIAPPATGTA